jgi:electron transport complex protein RnfG
MTTPSSTSSIPEKTNWAQRSYLVQAWLGITLALLFGVALAGVQAALGPKIEANKINETKEKVPELVLGRAAAEKMAAGDQHLNITADSVSVEVAGRRKVYSIYEARRPDGRLAGWVAKAKGMGYGDRIELLVGLDPDVEKLTGLFILDQKETPGLGNRIIEPAWRDQFIDKSTDKPLIVVKGKSASAGQINAITGATISSRSVTNLVNATVNDLKKPLAARETGRVKE